MLDFSLSLENNKNNAPTDGSNIRDDRIGKFINSKLNKLVKQKNLTTS